MTASAVARREPTLRRRNQKPAAAALGKKLWMVPRSRIPDPLAGAFSFFVMAVLAYAVIGLAVRVLISPIGFL